MNKVQLTGVKVQAWPLGKLQATAAQLRRSPHCIRQHAGRNTNMACPNKDDITRCLSCALGSLQVDMP